MRRTNGFSFLFYESFLTIETIAAPGNPAPTGTTQTSSRAAPPNPHRTPRSTFLLRALLLQTRVARGGPGTDHTTDSQGSHPKEPDARIVQPMCPNKFFKLFLLLQVKDSILNLKCSEPDVSGFASRVEKNFSPELSLYSGGLLF